MGCGENSLSSNVTGLAYAEEVALKILPDGTVGVDDAPGATTTTSGEFSDIVIAWDDVTRRITITGKIAAFEPTAVARITQAGSVVGVVGELVSINSPGNFVGSDPTGTNIAQWAGAGQAGTTDLIAVAYIPSVADGDSFTVEFDIDSSFNSPPASRVLTVTTLGTGVAKWYELEPNSYDSLGSEIETVARSPINASRQQKKGVVTDVTADGGFNTDITQTNLQRLMQGFFFAKAHERATSSSIKSAADSVTLTSVASTTITIGAGDEVEFYLGSLVKLSGFANAANNGVFEVTAKAAGALTCAAASFTTETAPAGAKLEIVGYEFAASDVSVTVTGNKFVMASAANKFLELGVQVGEWIHVGGDAIINRLVSNAPGFARVAAVAADGSTLSLEQCSWATPQIDTGTARQLQVYLGSVIRNEKDPTLIKCQSYQLERQLGQDAFGTQSQYLVGAVANEFKLNIPSVEKLNSDVSFTALDTETRNGSTGLKPGTRVTMPVESAFNTTSHIYQTRLYVHDDDAITPDSLFAFVMDGELTINNNVDGLKAIGTLGSMDLNVGDFEVSGTLNVYFATVAAVEAVRANKDVGFNVITALDNAGFVFDIPLLSLGGGRLEVEKDAAIMLPLETMAAENESGYTLLSTWFAYLPTVSMDS
jgi:hypothetical protein